MKIAILSGGTSAEREIAVRSSEFFIENLEADYDYYLFPEELEKFLQNKDKYGLAIPVFHGTYGEDGKIFAFLEVLGIKTVFSYFETHALCLNKFRTNEILKSIGVNIPRQFIYKGTLEIDNFPLIIKPNRGGSSMFTYKVDNKTEFDEKIAYVLEKVVDDDILVQEFIAADEYSVSVVAGEVLPIMKLEKQNQNDMFDYENKYLDKPKIIETWPKIPENLENKLKTISKQIYDFLGCRGYSRVDLLVRGENVYFLEVNTIPGMTKTSIVPKSWKILGREYKDLVKVIIEDV